MPLILIYQSILFFFHSCLNVFSKIITSPKWIKIGFQLLYDTIFNMKYVISILLNISI